MQRDYRIVRPHSRKCTAVLSVARGDWDTPWAFLEKQLSCRKDGSVNPSDWGQRWWEVRCNDTQCRGLARVREDACLRLIPQGPQR